jgi:hypothetical protein
MCTVKWTHLLFMGLMSVAAAAITNEVPAQDITDTTSSERTGKMSAAQSATVLAEIAREMVMRSTTNSQASSLLFSDV